MVRIALLFPSPGFFEEAQSIFEEHCQFQKDFENITEQYTLDELVVPSNQFVPSMVEPVSYTHLDVYKRQAGTMCW